MTTPSSVTQARGSKVVRQANESYGDKVEAE